MEKRVWWPFLWVAVALMPILFLRDFTPANELRYLSIADEALTNHTFFAFTNHGLAYADKPPLYLWIVMACKWLTGQHFMWLLGLFSLLPALVIAWVMGEWSRKEMKYDFRVESALMLLTCGLFSGMSIFLRMDMLMTMFIVLALRSFYRYWEDSARHIRERWLMPVWIFLAVFTKGPMGVLIPLVTTTTFLFFKRDIKFWPRIWGWRCWFLLISLCAAWFGAVYGEGGQGYLDNLLVKQTVGRAVNSFHHQRPFWYYFKTIGYTLAPWSFLIIGCICVSIMRWKRGIGSDLEKFYLTAGLSTLVLLSFISSKIDVYLLPAYPFFVYLAALIVSDYGWTRLTALSVSLPAIAVGLCGVAAGVLLFADKLPVTQDVLPITILGLSVLVIGCIITILKIYKGKRLNQGIRWFACTLTSAIFLLSFLLPRYNADLGYGVLCSEARNAAEAKEVDRYYSWKLSRAENMDVYLDKPLIKVETAADSTEFYKRLENRGAIVMAKRNRMPRMTKGSYEIETAGDNLKKSKYAVVWLAPAEK